MKNSCYGPKKKEELVANYTLEPKLFLALLANQEKKGCCGKLTNNYYIFNAIHKETKTESTFFVGKHCAEEILKLINKEPLRLFNPLRTNQQNAGQVRNGTRNVADRPNINHINQELINAVMLISMARNTPPSTGLLTIINYTNNKPNYINHKGIKWVSEYIMKYDSRKRTLQQIYIDLRADNPNMKGFNFDALRTSFLENNPNTDCFF